MSSPHPEELRSQFLYSITHYDWHIVIQHYGHHSVVIITTKLPRQLAFHQTVVKVLLACLHFLIGVLQVPDQFLQFLTVELSDVLKNNTNVLRVVPALELFIVGCVLKDDGFAEVVDGRSTQNRSTLLECLFVVDVVCNDHVNAV